MTAAREAKGDLRVINRPGSGCTFEIQLPTSRSVRPVLICLSAQQLFGIPLANLETVDRLNRDNIVIIEGVNHYRLDDKIVGLVGLDRVLELDTEPEGRSKQSIVVVSTKSGSIALIVDEILGNDDIVAIPIDERFGKIKDLSAVAQLRSGEIVTVLEPEDLVASAKRLQSYTLSTNSAESAIKSQTHRKILIVDDSVTVRELERKILNEAGFETTVAVDGADGWNLASSGNFDLIISDIDMPRMNGIEMVKLIKSHEKTAQTPVIIVSYKDRSEDRLAGLQAGADYYLTKGSFHDQSFLSAVRDLIGVETDVMEGGVEQIA
jgi:two-component system sensor histidine kinase and response regulator WspE